MSLFFGVAMRGGQDAAMAAIRYRIAAIAVCMDCLSGTDVPAGLSAWITSAEP